MSTLNATNLKNPSSVSNNIVLDSSGRVLVGAASNNTQFGSSVQIVGASADATQLWQRSTTGTGGPELYLAKSRGTASSPTVVAADDAVGLIDFRGYSGAGANYVQAASIQAFVDGTPDSAGDTTDMPGRLIFSTTGDGSGAPSERMRIQQNGVITAQGIYDFTTANAANVTVLSAGQIYRSTSSSKYKTDIETLQDQYADALLNCRPVWYRSTCESDCPQHSWWGFIAEEVAEIDPRLVHWKTTKPVQQENGSLEHVPCEPEPEGVAYDRFVPHLLNLIKRQQQAIETLEAKVAALEAA